MKTTHYIGFDVHKKHINFCSKTEAAKLAPRWNPQLATLHARELERGHRNRATLAVARKLCAYLLAVDKSGQPFQVRSIPPSPATADALLATG